MGLFLLPLIASIVFLIVGLVKRNQGMWITALTTAVVFALALALWVVVVFLG